MGAKNVGANLTQADEWTASSPSPTSRKSCVRGRRGVADPRVRHSLALGPVMTRLRERCDAGKRVESSVRTSTPTSLPTRSSRPSCTASCAHSPPCRLCRSPACTVPDEALSRTRRPGCAVRVRCSIFRRRAGRIARGCREEQVDETSRVSVDEFPAAVRGPRARRAGLRRALGPGHRW